jgi:hypothetical protein
MHEAAVVHHQDVAPLPSMGEREPRADGGDLLDDLVRDDAAIFVGREIGVLEPEPRKQDEVGERPPV